MRVCLEHDFFNLLKVAIAKEYGAERLTKKEMEEKIRKGELNADVIKDY